MATLKEILEQPDGLAQLQEFSERMWARRANTGGGYKSDFSWCAFARACRRWQKHLVYQGDFQFCVHGCPIYALLGRTCHGWGPVRGWDLAGQTNKSTTEKKRRAREIYDWLVANHDELTERAQRIWETEKGPPPQQGWLDKIRGFLGRLI